MDKTSPSRQPARVANSKLKLDKRRRGQGKNRHVIFLGKAISVPSPRAGAVESLLEAIISSCFGSWVTGVVIQSIIQDSSSHQLTRLNVFHYSLQNFLQGLYSVVSNG